MQNVALGCNPNCKINVHGIVLTRINERISEWGEIQTFCAGEFQIICEDNLPSRLGARLPNPQM